MQRIVTAVYPNRQQAEAAKAALKSANVNPDEVHIIDRDSEMAQGRYEESNKRYSYLRDSSIPDEELHTYHDALDRGETLVQARVRDEDTGEAVRILEGGSAVDLDEREKSYTDEHRFGTRNAYRGEAPKGETRNAKAGETIPVVEERMHIGKRERDRGSVKVRSYVTEKPVEKDVSLRQENVEVDRHKADRKLSGAEAEKALSEGGKTVQVHERSEEPVIDKEAVVKEEVEVKKTSGTKDKHVIDKIRSTEVDVEDNTGHRGKEDRRSDDQPRR